MLCNGHVPLLAVLDRLGAVETAHLVVQLTLEGKLQARLPDRQLLLKMDCGLVQGLGFRV